MKKDESAHPETAFLPPLLASVMHASRALASLVCGSSLSPSIKSRLRDYFLDVILWLMLLEFPEILKKFPVTAVRMFLKVLFPYEIWQLERLLPSPKKREDSQ